LTKEGKSILIRIEDQLTNKMSVILAAMAPAMRDILLISLQSFLQTAATNDRASKVDIVN